MNVAVQVLSYNSNLHPAESVDELINTLDEFASEVRRGLGWDELGLDLRLGSSAIEECRDPEKLKQLAGSLEHNHISVYTLNAFPLSVFQSTVVKDRAYDPDWTTPLRLNDSLDLIRIAMSLSNHDFMTISTLPGSFKPWAYNDQLLRRCARAYGTWAAAAAEMEAECGRWVQLAIEPEPWCFLENTAEVIAFWQGPLMEDGLAACTAALDGDQAAAEAALQRHLGICFDTCHFSLAFEDQVAAVNKLEAAQIPIHKVQFSAALEVRNPHQDPDAVAALQAMQERRFLHQTCVQSDNGSLYKTVDLDQLPQALAHMPTAACVRSHFHIPVFWPAQERGLSSTIADSRRGLDACLAQGASHIAVETYTWSVLADNDNGAIAGTIQELEFLSDLVDDA